MRQVKSNGTSPEMKVRRALHAAGFRYRLHRKDLPGNPDLVLPRFRIALFIHGCFWHWHGCKRSRMPQDNRSYWETKIQRNVARDRKTLEALKLSGWSPSIIWECELSAGTERLIEELSALKASPR